ncbi:MAG TPA: phosphatase PAP2 family protein [Gemmatimonadaceae bacterium]|nr:phosphatase PAP2 family protein [Gemmatimonadaceae bacterium]
MSRRLSLALFALSGLAACTDASSFPTAVDPAPSVATIDAGVAAADRVTAAALWNQRTRAVIGRRGGSSNFAARTFALVSVAQYDAVIAAEEAKDGGVHPSEAAASAAASAAVLAGLYAPEKDLAEQQLASDQEYFATLPSERDADWDAGVAVGRAVAAAVLAYAATDGSRTPWDGTRGPGGWIPITLPPQDAMWGKVRPWLMTSGDQFHPVDPPAIGSPEYLTDLAEVRSFSDNRTPEQLAIARYWASGYGFGGPAGYFGTLATQLGTQQHMDERRMSRLLAVMHMAIMDASIGCYQAKYEYWYIRPYQADAGITVASGVSRPNFPSYPSAHSCLSSAAAGVLASYFPAEKETLDALVEEAGMSRIYAGLHFRFDVTAGQRLGYGVAEMAVREAPEGHRAIPIE